MYIRYDWIDKELGNNGERVPKIRRVWCPQYWRSVLFIFIPIYHCLPISVMVITSASQDI